MELNNYFKDIKRNMRIYFNIKNRKMDVPFGIMHFVMALYHADGQNMRELSEELLVDKAHTTRAVRELESRGLAICKEDEKDKRIKRLHLTPRGKSIAQQAENTMNEWSNALFKGLSEEELKTLGDILKKAYDNTHELIESIKRD